MLSLSVIATGFEPVTVCLEGRCSIQLSYATEINNKNKNIIPLDLYFTLKKPLNEQKLLLLRRDRDSNPGNAYALTD